MSMVPEDDAAAQQRNVSPARSRAQGAAGTRSNIYIALRQRARQERWEGNLARLGALRSQEGWPECAA